MRPSTAPLSSGKRANCQALVSLTLAKGEVPVCVALRLFLPKAWAEDEARRAAAGVPEAIEGRSKGQIALAEIDRLLAKGVRFGCVLGDAEYGKAATFRHGLSARDLRWALGIAPNQKVYPAEVTLSWPAPKPNGRPRKHPVPWVKSIGVAALFKARWACEQAHQQMKEELGLDHLECRSWRALEHHALMTMLAFAFLQQLRLREKSWRSGRRRATAAAEPTRGAPPDRARLHQRRAALPALSAALRLLPATLDLAA